VSVEQLADTLYLAEINGKAMERAAFIEPPKQKAEQLSLEGLS